MQEPEEPWYCVDCGVRLKAEHDYCWNCGARRYRETAAPTAPPPWPRPAADTGAVPGLGGVRFFFAFWGVLLLVWATYSLANVLSPVGRTILLAGSSGLTPEQALGATAGLISAAVLLAALHGVAYHGITTLRVGGWVVGVVVAGLWSIVLVGLPALYVLLLRSTREAFGLA